MQTVSKQQLVSRGSELEDFVLINVLPRKLFQERHIPHSVSVPFQEPEFVNLIKTIAGSTDRELIIYCKNSECNLSTQAHDALQKQGFDNLFVYKGGVEDWYH